MLTYTIDPAHSTADFKVRHLMVTNVRGEFSGVSGTVIFDDQNPLNSKVEAKIDVNTVQTRELQRDAHLKSGDFFDAEKYPFITFVSKRVVKDGGTDHKVIGDLTIRGVTHEVTLDVEGPTPEIKDPWGNQRIGASAATKIRRKDFGLTWNMALEAGGVAVGDEVSVHLDLALTRPAA
jgi:polyisoprenoid-binding protein YceI